MTWTNSSLILYHGTDHQSAKQLSKPVLPYSHGIDLKLGRTDTDFGKGFYTTTNLDQAKNWANRRAQCLMAKKGGANLVIPAVVKFSADRDQLAILNTLCFVVENSNNDFWDFIKFARNGAGNHLYQSNQYYDVVYGPVSIWPQTHVIKDCDQISFHTISGIKCLSNPYVFTPPSGVTLFERGTP